MYLPKSYEPTCVILGCIMWVLIAVVFTTAFVTEAKESSSLNCPPEICSCSQSSKAADCSSRGLLKPPPGLPFLNLRSLDLSNNELKIINTEDILKIEDLEILDLSSNKITELAVSKTHYKIRELDLSSNKISTVRSLQLQKLVHLTKLNLANNKLISLPPNAFPGGTLLR